MAEPALQLKDGDRIAAALRAAPAAMKREMRTSNRATARLAAGWVRSAASSGSPQQARMAKGIGWSSNSTQAVMTLRNTAGAPGAFGAFYGAKQFPQFPRWVGNAWTPATRGEGPYVINPALARHEADIEAIYLQGQLDAASRALPRF